MNSPATGSPSPVDRDVWLDCPDTDASDGRRTTFLGLTTSRRLLPCALPLGQRTYVLRVWPQNQGCKKLVPPHKFVLQDKDTVYIFGIKGSE